MPEIQWKRATIFIEQKGLLYWKWEVRDDEGRYLSHGMSLTKWGATRRSARYRKGVITTAT